MENKKMKNILVVDCEEIDDKYKVSYLENLQIKSQLVNGNTQINVKRIVDLDDAQLTIIKKTSKKGAYSSYPNVAKKSDPYIAIMSYHFSSVNVIARHHRLCKKHVTKYALQNVYGDHKQYKQPKMRKWFSVLALYEYLDFTAKYCAFCPNSDCHDYGRDNHFGIGCNKNKILSAVLYWK